MMDDQLPNRDRRRFLVQSLAVIASPAVASAARLTDESVQESATRFLEEYNTSWLPLETASNNAAWTALTDVTEAHTAAQVAASQKLNDFVGSKPVLEKLKTLLDARDQLDELTVRQLEKARLRAAEAPATIPDVVTARIEAEARQSAAQDGFVYLREMPDAPAKPYSPNEIDRVLVESRDLAERQAVWELSKTVGAPLRSGLLRLRDLRNQVARELGFDSFFALQVADYGMTVPEMIDLCDGFITQIRPLQEQIHAWAKHELAKRYGTEAPDGPIPAHWLPTRWGQNWPGMVEGIDMDAPFAGKSREFITEQAERFYVSLGMPPLPKSFYEKSDLYPADPKSGRKKNSHASAWHVDLRKDVRSLMSIEPNSQWFNTAHHELGHIYYYINYSTPAVPPLLRAGANRAFHEGIGDLIGVAASQKPYLKSVGLLSDDAAKADPIMLLLDAALDRSIVFMPFAAGTMTRFERDFYEGKIADDALNNAWWSIVRKYQGITPPAPRPETLCDAATKTHINHDPGPYYDYAIGTVIKFQLHDHIAREILKQDPRECNYYGNKQVGAFLQGILKLGATRDWNAVLRESTGSGLSAKPMVDYFQPLNAWLARQNDGRKLGW
jgi:peptidyl-dipeptidase A